MDTVPAGLLFCWGETPPVCSDAALFKLWRRRLAPESWIFFSALAPLRERDAFQQYLAPVRKAEWVVYAKRPFAGPEQVLDYVGRYTHRVAISNNRIFDVEDGKVRFRWKDYRHGVGLSRPGALAVLWGLNDASSLVEMDWGFCRCRRWRCNH